MKQLLKVILWPFEAIWKTIVFIYESIFVALGIAMFLASAVGIALGISGFFFGVYQAIIKQDASYAFFAIICLLVSGISLRIFNRILYY